MSAPGDIMVTKGESETPAAPAGKPVASFPREEPVTPGTGASRGNLGVLRVAAPRRPRSAAGKARAEKKIYKGALKRGRTSWASS